MKISAKESLPFLDLGDSDDVDVGDWVLAIGSPYRLNFSVTAGIISAKARSVPGQGTSYIPFYNLMLRLIQEIQEVLYSI